MQRTQKLQQGEQPDDEDDSLNGSKDMERPRRSRSAGIGTFYSVSASG
jgi:hypothetical protein